MTKNININGYKFELELEPDKYGGSYIISKVYKDFEDTVKEFLLEEREKQAMTMLLAKLLITDSLKTVNIIRLVSWDDHIGDLVKHKESGKYNILAGYNEREEHLEMVDASIAHASQWELIEPLETNLADWLVVHKETGSLSIVKEHLPLYLLFTDNTRGQILDYNVVAYLGAK